MEARQRARAALWWIAGALGLGAVVSPNPVAAAGLVGTQTNSLATGDFDGDGLTDYAYGYPNWSFGEGKVVIVYGDEKIQVWNRDSPWILYSDANYNYFGDSVTAGDFDADGYDDLAIGVPGDDHEGVNAGSLHIFYGTASGFNGDDQVIDQDSAGIKNIPENHDYYAEFLATGDFDCDGYDDVAVGIPREGLNAGSDAGAVNVIYGSSGGISTVDDWYHQNTSGVPGSAHGADNFGGSLLAANFNGDTAYGRACTDLAVGVPGEYNVYTDAGAFHVFFGAYSSGLGTASTEYITQNTAAVEDSIQYGDMFSSWLNAAQYVVDGYDDLVVRAPFDTCGLPAGATGFHFFKGTSSGLLNSYGYASGDDLECVYVDAGVQEIVDAYSICILDPGVCHCSEEFAFAVENDTTIAPLLQPVWMCTEKSKAATAFCESVSPQSGPTVSTAANDCIEASVEAWQDCLGSEIEQG